MKIIYENEWDRSVVHVDTELPYEENYQMRMLRHNELRSLVKVTGIGREGKYKRPFVRVFCRKRTDVDFRDHGSTR